MSWLDQQIAFSIVDMPVHLGRVEEAQFMVNDQRVSRLHARIDWKNGSFTLTDLSSYGTWVRFGEGGTELELRRDECVLVAAKSRSARRSTTSPCLPWFSAHDGQR